MWNGSLSPKFTKTIGTVRYVPLFEMTSDDWRILEFENLRTVAKNRIASLLAKGELVGFFHVHVLEKAKAKPDYFWPATAGAVAAFREEQSHDFFRNERDQDIDNEASQDVVFLMDRMAGYTRVALMILLRILSENAPEEATIPAEVIAAVGAAALTPADTLDLIASKIDELELVDFTFLLTNYMLRLYTIEEADAILNDVDAEALAADFAA